MNSSRRYDAPRWLGYLLSFVAFATLILAMANTPLIEWSTAEFVVGTAIAACVVAFFVAAFRNRFNLVGNLKGSTGLVLSIVGTFISGVVLGANVFADEWSAANVLLTGIFVAAGVMFIASAAISGDKIKHGD